MPGGMTPFRTTAAGTPRILTGTVEIQITNDTTGTGVATFTPPSRRSRRSRRSPTRPRFRSSTSPLAPPGLRSRCGPPLSAPSSPGPSPCTGPRSAPDHPGWAS